jgi:NAD(P)-dependent dehydrogenase (short-subunit alcohol dehydrogenase family)
MADLVAFLASARASYLSGVVIDADGGALYR